MTAKIGSIVFFMYFTNPLDKATAQFVPAIVLAAHAGDKCDLGLFTPGGYESVVEAGHSAKPTKSGQWCSREELYAFQPRDPRARFANGLNGESIVLPAVNLGDVVLLARSPFVGGYGGAVPAERAAAECCPAIIRAIEPDGRVMLSVITSAGVIDSGPVYYSKSLANCWCERRNDERSIGASALFSFDHHPQSSGHWADNAADSIGHQDHPAIICGFSSEGRVMLAIFTPVGARNPGLVLESSGVEKYFYPQPNRAA